MHFIILGALAYMYLSRNQATAKMSPTHPGSFPSPYQPAQPSLVYPFTPISPPRVDNKNQPWYNNARQFMASPADSAQGVSGTVSSVVHSLSDVWGNLNDYFGANDNKSNLVSSDQVPIWYDTSNSMLASSDDQSSTVGDIFSEDQFINQDNYDLSSGFVDTGSYNA